MPTTRAQFLEVSGVGQAKLEKYGEAFLAEIKAYQRGSSYIKYAVHSFIFVP
ncbi:HRDC domain-containing protein [Bacillota bacterium LX-D]|nr:HRDC domain-containing protein [Bacillota bacterium LX-D]